MYVSSDDCLPVCLELDDNRWDEHFMANIAGAQECNKMKKVGVTLKVTYKIRQPFHNLSYKEAIPSLEQVQHFLECHGMNVEENASSTTVDRIAAVAIHAKLQTTLHDYLTS